MRVLPNVYAPVQSWVVLPVAMPFSNAANATSGLTMEPGMYFPENALLNIGLPSVSRSKRRNSVPLSSAKLYVGAEAAARIAPSSTFNATNAPACPASAASADCWALASNVRTRSMPSTGELPPGNCSLT